MANSLSTVQETPVALASQLKEVGPPAASAQSSAFTEALADMAREVHSSQKTADAKMEAVSAGDDNDLHGAMIAMEQASIQLRLMTTVRNRVIEAYREVMRMGA